MNPVHLTLDGQSLTLEALAPLVAGERVRAEPVPAAWDAVRRSAAALQALDLAGAPLYGINTGFGSLCNVAVAPAELAGLQTNLLRSHACGVGDPTPPEVVRIMLALKAQSFCRGHSSIRPEVVERLLLFLAEDALPLVPAQGSLGASGDLAPLAHLSLPLIGEGAFRMADGSAEDAAPWHRVRGLEPLRLGPKEGLALINGTQFLTAHAAAALVRARHAARTLDCAAAMSLEAMAGRALPFDERIAAVRPHRGVAGVMARIRGLTKGSALLDGAGAAPRVQDPYSFRCVPQVHGAACDALAYAEGVVETELNSTTDNPLVLEDGSYHSGGNFHGEPVALAMDFAAIAMTELASISERRVFWLLEGARVGLPPMLAGGRGGLHSGFMIAQYTAAALVSECKLLAHPASVDTIPSSNGQEDHVSMGSIAARKALSVAAMLERVAAVELLCAAQALDARGAERAGAGTRALHARVRELAPPLEGDRPLSCEIECLARALGRGEMAPHGQGAD
ncbi:MAG: histidine ammonia-lyase [Candidatus Sumerlaeia bacterium]|nr:histidine ammonia-lyase [Candidatus Sumerlaeia bacterium]